MTKLEGESQINIIMANSEQQLTFNGHFRKCLTGADVVGGHTFVCSSVTLSGVSYLQLSIFSGLRSRRKARPAHPAPREEDGMRAMSETLQV